MARSRHSIPEPVVACMTSDRSPTVEEIEAVASSIWAEVGEGAMPWRDVSPGSPAHRRIMWIARNALGLSPTWRRDPAAYALGRIEALMAGLDAGGPYRDG